MAEKHRTIVWGTGNVGQAAIRSVLAHPDLVLSGVIVHSPDKVGRDAGALAGMDVEAGIVATGSFDDLKADTDAVVYAASGDIRPDDALADIVRAVAAGAVVVTPSLYALYDPRSAP
ncbi:dihydrodipicolinate reductase, partial [Streptomyces sp. SID10244]|nr:dihydrodipicolinate reductase [Streptomyces sp. SID10244]